MEKSASFSILEYFLAQQHGKQKNLIKKFIEIWLEYTLHGDQNSRRFNIIAVEKQTSVFHVDCIWNLGEAVQNSYFARI